MMPNSLIFRHFPHRDYLYSFSYDQFFKLQTSFWFGTIPTIDLGKTNFQSGEKYIFAEGDMKWWTFARKNRIHIKHRKHSMVKRQFGRLESRIIVTITIQEPGSQKFSSCMKESIWSAQTTSLKKKIWMEHKECFRACLNHLQPLMYRSCIDSLTGIYFFLPSQLARLFSFNKPFKEEPRHTMWKEREHFMVQKRPSFGVVPPAMPFQPHMAGGQLVLGNPAPVEVVDRHGQGQFGHFFQGMAPPPQMPSGPAAHEFAMRQGMFSPAAPMHPQQAPPQSVHQQIAPATVQAHHHFEPYMLTSTMSRKRKLPQCWLQRPEKKRCGTKSKTKVLRALLLTTIKAQYSYSRTTPSLYISVAKKYTQKYSNQLAHSLLNDYGLQPPNPPGGQGMPGQYFSPQRMDEELISLFG
ncbi:hypothetical protein CAEBREN_19754 [Caenorhabditis brenneri]|uniref:Uncharacterized protein n=1 Tax=Caenorhabditis brenneri TaxID=135651 RepID=G0NP76_CAEBE|nr:hypothetical protein CAEBREN_19754 [Caenorhabditis brenneri]